MKKQTKRPFILMLPKREVSTLDMRTPLGVTPPSPTCLPDSVMALVCPKCLCIWYISLGLFRHLFQAQHVADALMPGVFNWLNPKHVPCDAIMRPVSLDERIDDTARLKEEEEHFL